MKIRMIVAALATAALMTGAALATPAANNSNKYGASNKPATQKVVVAPKSKSDTGMSKSKTHKVKRHKGKKSSASPSAK